MKDKEEHKHYGESGLSPDFFDDYEAECTEEKVSWQNRQEIVRALTDAGFESTMEKNPLFREYLSKVAEGPGTGWEPYRQARFALQTMNRCGVIDWPKNDRAVPAETPKTAKTDHESEKKEPAPATMVRQRRRSNIGFEIFKDYFRDYHRLTLMEIKDNLIVVAGIFGVVLLAAASVAIGVALDKPAVGAGGGAISITAFIAVATRLAGKYHHRFGMPYRITRLVVCLALLFSKAAWAASRELWEWICSASGTYISPAGFGVSLSAILLMMAVWTHAALCRTDDPDRAGYLGWIEALAVTFAIGALMFVAINK